MTPTASSADAAIFHGVPSPARPSRGCTAPRPGVETPAPVGTGSAVGVVTDGEGVEGDEGDEAVGDGSDGVDGVGVGVLEGRGVVVVEGPGSSSGCVGSEVGEGVSPEAPTAAATSIRP